MSNSAHSALKSLVRPYVKRILLKTHPDYFAQDTVKKKINAASLQSLQNVLSPLLKGSAQNTTKAHSEKPTKLDFYVKNGGNRSILKVEHKFPTSHAISIVEKWYTAASLLELCKKIGIQVMPSDIDAIQSMIDTLNKESAAAKRGRAPPLSLTQVFADELYRSHNMDPASIMPEQTTSIADNELLFFPPKMSEKSKAIMVEKLQKALPLLRPNRWWRKIPIVIVDDIADIDEIDTAGILVFAPNMSIEDMAAYVESSLATKEEEYQKIVRGNSYSKS
ncbi:hypothetical protein INT43_005470 [Umbelopsis isabellina]|uniref:DUF4460 domain-containing protein n=1 Tax=Mortierella isabellina TaxID=91625 RepID=A0A8H7PN52_MORIS|nr:hypothetical protein INT43_005470 [Umbelopsis isabellina]